jgi:hypothetical protein
METEMINMKLDALIYSCTWATKSYSLWKRIIRSTSIASSPESTVNFSDLTAWRVYICFWYTREMKCGIQESSLSTAKRV